MFVTKEGRYWASQWFLSIGDGSVDMLGNLFRDRGEPWQLIYRVAFRRSNAPDDAVKRWYKVDFDGRESKEEVVALVHKLFSESAVAAGIDPKDIVRTDFDSDDQEAVTLKLISLPHSHVRTMGAGPVGQA